LYVTIHFFSHREHSVLHLENLWVNAVWRDNRCLS